MSNVIQMNPADDPDHVLRESIGFYDELMIIGWDKEGDLVIRSTGKIQANEALWMVQKFTHKLMNGDYEW